MPNAEATGAREALLHACADLNCDGETEASALVREFADKHYPAPAPRKVRAEVEGSTGWWFELRGGNWRVSTPIGESTRLPRSDVALLSVVQSRADAEGMVEEGLGAVDAPRACEVGTEQDTIGRSADVPAPSPALKHRYVDRPPLVIDEGDTPSASPEADGRVWWLYRTAEGWRADEESGEPDAIPVVPREALEAERRALGVYQRGVEEMTRELAQIVCGENEDYIPRSDLARVQRERDEYKAACEAMAPADMLADLQHEVTTLRAKITAAVQERDEALESLDSWKRVAIATDQAVEKEIAALRAERAAALDRARAAEQRIETGVVCWRDEQGCYWQQEPNDLGRRRHGPFTRGRFVADQENGQ